jgi:hypothetical protein
MFDGDKQVLLRRSQRAMKARRFLRPEGGAASGWMDAPTTAAEEASRAAKIPSDITIGSGEWLAVPLLPPNFDCCVEVPGEDTLMALKPITFKQEKELGDDPVETAAEDSPSECSVNSEGHCKWHTVRATHRRHCKWHTVRAIHRRHRDVYKIEFATLPTAVGEESEDDKTAEMDTVDREDEKHTKGDFWNWEMRK